MFEAGAWDRCPECLSGWLGSEFGFGFGSGSGFGIGFGFGFGFGFGIGFGFGFGRLGMSWLFAPACVRLASGGILRAVSGLASG